MIRNYLKIAWRNLSRNKVFSFINIAGLSIGLACCMLILLYTKDEVSYDKFHEKKDNLYQITCKITEKDGKEMNYGIASMIQGPTFKEEIPEIEACVRVKERDYVLKRGNETFYEIATWVDDNFFTVFSFPMIEGNPKTVLSDMNSVVLTEEIAEKYFGKTSPIGKVMELEMNDKFEPFVVTGIAKNAPQNSSIKFKMLLSYKYEEAKNNDTHWLNLSYPTYFVLNPKANIKNVEAKMAQVFASKAGKEIEEEKKHGFEAKFTYGVNSLVDMHLNTKYQYNPEASNPIYSYILSGIALFILLIACINFVNLTVAQSLRRGKEIGIRKVVGGERKQLIWQFLGESFLLCFFAFSLAFVLAQLALPVFNDLANKRLELSYLFDYQLVVGFILLFVLTVFAAGFYPSLVLSGFDPVKTLYNRFKFSDKNYLSKGLVVLQFSLATFMIITTFFIYNQFDYLTHKSLGYNDKNLLIVSVGQDNNQALQQTFKNEFSKIPGIQAIALRQNGFWGTGSKANNKDISVAFEHVDEDYLPTLQIPLAAGRNFSKAFPGDSTNSVLVNEAYIKEAGWKGTGVGNTIDFLNGQASKKIIVGVVKDYHYGSLREKILPQLFTMQPNMAYGRFFLRIDPTNKPKTLAAIEKIYHTLVPYRPFKYDYMEDMNFKNYESEAKWKQIIGFGSILMIFISCIGLFGLTMLSIQQRTKEIGIRKVLGATIFQISSLLSKNYIGLVFIAFVVAIPAAWYATTKWLENFAYKIDISWQIFALAAILTIIVAFLTVSYQAIRAALMNPVKSLKTE
jgi:putative ABC transport system permease protein